MSYGTDVVEALKFFKRELRPRLKNLEGSTSNLSPSSRLQELCTAYMGIYHLCGLSGRPDLALQIFYAMLKDGIARTPRVWEAYQGGKEAAAGTAGFVGGGVFMLPSFEAMLRLESTAQADEKIAKAIPFKRIRIKW